MAMWRRLWPWGVGACVAALAVACLARLFISVPASVERSAGPLEFFQQREEAMRGFTGVLGQFAEQYPEIDIQQRNVPSALELLIARMQQFDVPDLFTHWPTQTSFAAAVQQGLVMDISDIGMEGVVSEAALSMIRQQDGKLYALPLNHNCMEVYYNVDLFERLGIQPPETIDELFSICESLRAAGIQPMIDCVRDTRMAHVAQACFAVLVPDYIERLAELGAGTISAEGRGQLLRAIELFLRLYDYARPDSGEAYTYYQACERFARGESAMFIAGSYALNPILEFEPSQRIAVFPLPGDDPAHRVILTGIDTAVCASASTPMKEQAMQFLEFLMRPDIAQLYADGDAAPSCILSVRQQNAVTQTMRTHIETYENADWLKSRFPLEAVQRFEKAVDTVLITGDAQAFLDALPAIFAPGFEV